MPLSDLADIALDDSSGDLVVPIKLIRGAAVVQQRIRVRMRWFLGEWFLDTRQGVPYFEHILIKTPDLILIGILFKRVVLSVQGVKEVVKSSVTLDAPTRTLTHTYEALLDDDVRLEASEAFLI